MENRLHVKVVGLVLASFFANAACFAADTSQEYPYPAVVKQPEKAIFHGLKTSIQIPEGEEITNKSTTEFNQLDRVPDSDEIGFLEFRWRPGASHNLLPNTVLKATDFYYSERPKYIHQTGLKTFYHWARPTKPLLPVSPSLGDFNATLKKNTYSPKKP